MLKLVVLGKSTPRGNRMTPPFLLGGKPRRWLNQRVKPEVYTPSSLPPPEAGRKRYGVLGSPVAHSLSPSMQEAGFRALGIPAEYLRVEIPAGDLKEALPGLQKSGFAGWNCTLPHKEAMFALCPETDDAARESGTVNTVVVSEKGVRGHSTDADGWEDAVAEAWQMDLSSQRVLLFGCGGVGRTLAFRLVRRGCRHLRLANRTPSKATQLADKLLSSKKVPVSVVPWSPPELYQAVQDSDLLIQATPLGLSANDPLPVPESGLHPGLRIYDTVYHRDWTPLVRAARARHLPALDGLGMLLHQGARALSIWSGRPAPIAEMRAALEKAAGRPI